MMAVFRPFQCDLCIVGAGMIGSAAARYASISPGVKVCVIGPEEPKHCIATRGDEIFSTHYDNGRSACRTEHVDPFWADLAKASIATYRELEQMSGIEFFHEVGYMSVGCKRFLDKHTNTDFVKLTREDLREKLGYMQFADDDEALHDKLGGWINPRKLVDAELLVASKQGCDIIRDVVNEINSVQSDGVTGYELRTDKFLSISARRILLATNVFTMHRKLLPKHIRPKFNPSPQTVVMAEVDEADLTKLRSFPSMVYHGQGGTGWYKDYPRNKDGNVHFYGTSVVKYPDGKHYVKIGHSDDILDRYLHLSEVSQWYGGGGDPTLVKHLTELLKSMFTGLKFKSFKSDACVTMVTATGRPYIDTIGGNFGVAIGGNGHAAMSCDAIGRVAAHMILNCMDQSESLVQKRCELVQEYLIPGSKL